MDDHKVAVSANGKSIHINLMQRPASAAISRNPHLLSLLAEVLPSSKPTKQRVTLEYDLKRPLGYNDTVPSKAEDVIFYARQLHETAFTRFVKNRKTEATSILSIRLEEVGPDTYSITDVRIGKTPPPFPGESKATSESESYWAEHAVIYNGQPIIASSVTKDCPY